MAINVITWVWDHSRSKHGARLVLLAIADSASSDGAGAWPSIAELKRKANLGETAVHTAIADLVSIGELEVDYNAGPRGCNRYRVIMPPAPPKSVPPRNPNPPDSAPPPNRARRASAQGNSQTPTESEPPHGIRTPPRNPNQGPPESEPVTVLEPSLTSPLPPAAAGPEEGEGNQSPIGEATLIARIREIRPGWSTPQIRRVLANDEIRERPWPLVCAAFLRVAALEGTTSPGRLLAPGDWWNAPAATPAASPPRDVACPNPVHSKTYPAGTECPGCAADRKAIAS